MVYVLYGLGNNYSFKEELIINKTLFVVIALLYPLLDLLRVFVLRIIDGQSPFVADNRHIHHFLNKKLKSSYKVILTLFVFNLLILLLITS